MNKTLIALLLLLSACSSRHEASAPIAGAGTSKAFGGVSVSAESNNLEFLKYVAVFRTVKGDQYLTCTASVIAEDFVVVNAHCLQGDPATMQVFFFASSAKTSVLARVPAEFIRTVKHRAKPIQFAKFPDKDFNPYDIALIQLNKPAPTGVRFFSLSDQVITPQTARQLAVLGYGFKSMTIKDFDEKGDPIYENQGDMSLQVLYQDVVPSKIADMIELDGKNGRGTCIGDSGGPNFGPDESGQGLVLYGITAQRRQPPELRVGTDMCRVNSRSIDISIRKDWMLRAMELMRSEAQASAN